MRNLLSKDEKFRENFVGVLVGAYRTIICRWYPTKTFKGIYEESLTNLLPTAQYKRKDCEDLLT
jgi:hypothetical protein